MVTCPVLVAEPTVLSTSSVPALTVVGPVYKLPDAITTLPGPSTITSPPPLIAWFVALSWKVLVAPMPGIVVSVLPFLSTVPWNVSLVLSRRPPWRWPSG